jgi:hypothetical protein
LPRMLALNTNQSIIFFYLAQDYCLRLAFLEKQSYEIKFYSHYIRKKMILINIFLIRINLFW